jgi:hypothetical protein
VASFTPGPLYPREKSPNTHLIEGCVGPRAGLDDVGKRKFLTLPGLELGPLCRPARRQSQYRLRYPWRLEKLPVRSAYYAGLIPEPVLTCSRKYTCSYREQSPPVVKAVTSYWDAQDHKQQYNNSQIRESIGDDVMEYPGLCKEWECSEVLSHSWNRQILENKYRGCRDTSGFKQWWTWKVNTCVAKCTVRHRVRPHNIRCA